MGLYFQEFGPATASTIVFLHGGLPDEGVRVLSKRLTPTSSPLCSAALREAVDAHHSAR
jgi:hypothetical protein